MGINKKPYGSEVRQEAVRLVVVEGHSARSVSQQLNIHHTTIAGWVRKYRKGGIDLDPEAAVVDKDARIRELERELQRTRMERDFLKKATAFLEGDLK
jgi:transposase